MPAVAQGPQKARGFIAELPLAPLRENKELKSAERLCNMH